MLFDSAGPSEGYVNKEQERLNQEAGRNMDEVSRALRNLSPSQQAETLNMWSQMKGSSEYNIFGQRAIESMQSMRPNEDVVVFDIESLGTPSHMRKDGSAGFFSPTELAFQKGKYMNGDIKLGTSSHSALSVLMKPNEATQKSMKSAIAQLRSSGWRGLSADMQRSLVDVSAYSGDPSKIFQNRKMGGLAYTHVLGHAKKVSGNASLALPEALAKIEQGFHNLTKYGTAPESAVQILDRFIPNKRSTQSPVRMVGYNIYNYDEQALKEFFGGNVAKDNPSSHINKALARLTTGITNSKNVDLLHALKTTTADPYSRFGTDMTLGNVHKSYGFKAQGTAHHGLSDVGFTAQIFGKVNKQVHKAQSIVDGLSGASIQDRNTAPFYWDKTPLKAGSTVYAFNGLPAYNAGAYDGVFKRGADGTPEKSYNLRQNPVYARTMYKVDKFLEGIVLGGKNHFGVELSTDEGNVHTLFRETKEELQKAMHGHFLPVGKNGINKDMAMAVQNEDRGLRRYNRMFEVGRNSPTNQDQSNGFNLMKRAYGHLSETKGMQWGQAEAHLKQKYGGERWMTDSYLRDLKTMAPRLLAEEHIWKPVMEEAKALGTNAERTIALNSFRGNLQQSVGANKGVMATGGETVLQLKIGEETKHLRGLDRNGMIQTIRSSVEGKGGGIAKPNREVMINRFNELIEKNLIPAFSNMGDKSMTKKMRAIQSNFQREVMASNKVSTIYEEVATMVGKYMNTAHSSQGIELERVSSVSASYASNLKGFQADKKKIGDAVNSASHFGKNLNSFLAGDEVSGFLKTQTGHAESYLNMSGLKNGNLRNYDSAALSNITDVHSKVKGLAEKYMSAGFRVQTFYDKKNGLSMGIMDKNAPESLARSGYHGLRQSSNATVIHLPSYEEGGRIKWKSEQHLNRFVGNIDKGKLSVNTVYDQVFNQLGADADRLRSRYTSSQALGKKDFFINAQNVADKSVRNVLERSPMDYAKGYVENDEAFHVRSARADLNRSMYIDTSNFAEQWYREQHSTLSQEQKRQFGMFSSADDIKHSVGWGENFMQNMHWKTKARFNAQVDQWANDRFGLQADAHGVNDRHMSKGYRSLLDPRKMSATGAFDKTSGENRQKALNYIALDETNITESLKRQGETDAMIRLRTQYGTTNEFQDMARGNDIDGVSMRVAYMSDQQVAKSIATNRGKIDTELKKMLGNKEISMEEYSRYQSMLDNGQLNTYEGKAIMANKFKQVFDTIDDVRERLGDGYQLDGKMQNAMAAHARKLGISFNPNESIHFGDFGGGFMSVQETQKLMNKDGMITVGTLTTDSAVSQSYDARSNKEVFVKGWNAEEQMLILGKHNRGDEAMKTVTNTGRRHTESFAPKGILEIISGIKDTEAIIPHFSDSKGMHGAVLEEKVRVYEDELLRQLHGASPQSPAVSSFLGKEKVTMGSLSLSEQTRVEGKAISELLLPKLQKHLNVDSSALYERNGRVSFANGFGFDDKYSNMVGGGLKVSTGQMDIEIGQELNYQFRKDGVEVGQTIKQRHDVWADQFSVGQGSEGRVRVGLKELGALRQHISDVDPSASGFVDFLQSEVRGRAKGGQQARDVGQYIMNAMVNGYTPKAGDVVFDSSAMRPEVNGDINARMSDGGVMYVNPDTTNSLPQVTAKHTKIYSDQYAQTLLDTGRLKVNDGVTNTDVKSYLQQDGQYKGTAYLKLPDESFGASHMPLIDFENFERKQGDGGYLNEMQRTQRNVIDNVNAYNNLGKSGTIDPETLLIERTKLQKRVTDGMSALRGQANTYMSSGSKGSFLSSTANARLDMSGHFRAQGVNPFAQYSKDAAGDWQNTGNIKENVSYIHKNDFMNMIDGAEDNILSAWGDKTGFKDKAAKQAHILENVNKNGIYGPVIRYPIIDASTAQTVKFEVADWASEKSMYMGTGSVSRIAGDFDGDNFAAILTAYKTDKAPVYHKSLAGMYEKEQQSSIHEGRQVMAGLEGDMLKSLGEQGRSPEEAQRIVSTLQSNNMYTVQDLAKSGFDEGTIDQVMRAKTHAMDNVETVIARTGKEFIGHIDNARQRIQTLHGITQDTLSGAGQISSVAAAESKEIVNEVTRRLSQDSISSKKFTVQTLMKEDAYRTLTQEQLQQKSKDLSTQRNNMLAKLRDDLYNPNMNVEDTMVTMESLGIYDKTRTTDIEVGIGRTNAPKALQSMSDTDLFFKGLTAIRETNIQNQHIGGYNAASLKMGHSSGGVLDDLIQTGTGYAPTDAMQEFHRMANDETKARFDGYKQAYQSGVIRLHQQNNDAEQILSESTSSSQPKIEGRTILQDNYIDQKASARFRDVLDEIIPRRPMGAPAMGSVAAGAIGFSAIWAASSLMKTAPTPEGLREQVQGQGPRAPMEDLLTSPTARISENNGEFINIKINAKDARNMGHGEVASLVNQELQSMSGVEMNMNLNVQDNSQQIDQKWVQDLVANAVTKGYGF